MWTDLEDHPFHYAISNIPSVQIFFNFGGNKSFSLGHWYPCFWTSGGVSFGFSKPEWATLFALGGGVHVRCSFLYSILFYIRGQGMWVIIWVSDNRGMQGYRCGGGGRLHGWVKIREQQTNTRIFHHDCQKSFKCDPSPEIIFFQKQVPELTLSF